MKFMGSKARIAKEILPIILEQRKPDQWYVEPFAGGMNTICEVTGNRLANDNNRYLIAMWWYLISGIDFGYDIPKDIPKDFYDSVREVYNRLEKGELPSSLYDTIYPTHLIGWVGFMGSANGRFFDGGYSGKSNTKIGTVRDYIAEAIRNVEKQAPKMHGCKLSVGDYYFMEIPDNSIIYCDPPYKDTKQYSTSANFDHDRFWEWCRQKSKQGHTVFISEYQAPADFRCVWEKPLKSSLSANGMIGGNKNSVEKLFTI